MNQPVTERQHYVPVFYLNRFIGQNKKLCVYDRSSNRFFESSPKKICYEKMLYETAWVNASEQLGDYVLLNQLEKIFADVEGLYSSITEEILSTNNDELLIKFATENRKTLLELTINLYLRNPCILEDVMKYYKESEDIDSDWKRSVQELFDAWGWGSSVSIIEHSIKQSAFKTDVDGSPANVFINRMRRMYLTVIKSDYKPFITSSFPVLTSFFVGNPPKADMQVVFLPISPFLGLLFSDDNTDERSNKTVAHCEPSFVSFINNAYLDYSKEQARFLIANNRRIIEETISDSEENAQFQKWKHM